MIGQFCCTKVEFASSAIEERWAIEEVLIMDNTFSNLIHDARNNLNPLRLLLRLHHLRCRLVQRPKIESSVDEQTLPIVSHPLPGRS